MSAVDTQLLVRLQRGEREAWFELWDVFGPSIERMVHALGQRRFSAETLQDIRQETLLEVAESIHRFQLDRGVKFSTWLYAIARHIVASELEHRAAHKRNRGVRPLSLDVASAPADADPGPEEELEAEIFRAHVYQAMREVERESDFVEFRVYQMRLSGRRKAADVAAGLGISEATASRYADRVRERIRAALQRRMSDYAETLSGPEPLARHGLQLDREAFDGALGEILARVEADRRTFRSIAKSVRALP